MKPEDLDDHAPIEPDDGLLASVHTRSRSFRRRRTTQRFTTATAGLVVVALVVGIALTRTDTSADRKIQLPAASSTTTTPMSQATVRGKWIPVSVAGYAGALSKPPLSSVPHLRFDGDDRWSGSDGCNDLGGTYRVEEAGIHFLTFGGTLVGCQGTPDFEPIESAPRSEIRDGELTFLDSDGNEIARFVRSGITAHLELAATTITSGSTMTAHVVVENNTGHEIHATMCGSFFQVELRHGNDSSAGIWTQCAVPFTFPVGQSSYPVSVQASYGLCAKDSPGIPTCLPTGTRPLPPGDYEANLLQSSPVVALPPPIDVTVTAPGTTNTTTTTTTAPTTATPDERVTARIELPSTTMTGGSRMTGHVVVENNTGHEVHATGCHGLFAVSVHNAQIPQRIGFPSCAEDVTIPEGESSYPVIVMAEYYECDAAGDQGLQRCPPDGGSLPLPPGIYQVTLEQASPVVPPPPPIDVTVTP